MKLIASKNRDLELLATWIHDDKSCRYWAGPGVNFPFTLESLKKDIHYSRQNSFSMIDPDNNLVGFGQIIEKEKYLHLARIITSPDHRGKGYGKILCRMLIAKGKNKFGNRPFSLNVYAKNVNAVSLYYSQGFTPVNKSSISDSIYMILN